MLLLVIVLQVRVVWRGLIVLHVLSLFLLLVLILWTVLVLVLSKVVLVEPTFLSKTSFVVVVIATVSLIVETFSSEILCFSCAFTIISTSKTAFFAAVLPLKNHSAHIHVPFRNILPCFSDCVN